jgi:hypothetical protein
MADVAIEKYALYGLKNDAATYASALAWWCDEAKD